MNNGDLAAGPGTALFGMTTRTPDFVEINTLLTGTMRDSDVAVLDSSGLVIGVNDDYSFGSFNSLTGSLLPSGNTWILSTTPSLSTR